MEISGGYNQAPSAQGRALVLDQANQIWASKDKGLYGEMYETYSAERQRFGQMVGAGQ
ncbi:MULTISPECIES: hypothetical protein [Xanthomonas translucens group]|uniref:hypothetical protein n=1 Tax=Xanthomonas translucens group TaxID=3390202 RepID=UPI000AD70F19|nr:hypothetical protein [Xanthomonas translucens]